MPEDSIRPAYLLQDACALALHSIVARLDRCRDHQPYFKVDLTPPAQAVHDSWDYCDMAGRYVDALALIRQTTGLAATEEERALRAFLLRMQEPGDGLFYNQEGPNSQYAADMFCQSRVLIALCTWYMETRHSAVKARMDSLVQGLIRIAESRDGYVFYPRNLYRGGEWLEGGLFYQPKDLWSVRPGYGGTQIEGMMKWHELTGDERVLRFVDRYLLYFLDAAQAVREDGSFIGHLHSQGIVPTMVGAAMYAEATGDADLLALCERCLRFILAHSSRFGWIPDGILEPILNPQASILNLRVFPTCETCAIGDVIYLAVRLSRLGQGDYWYEVERFARNQLLENQIRHGDLALEGRDPAPGLEQMVTGSFASWAKPNDLLGGPDLEGCCTGGGVRALFHVLSNAVAREADGAVTVRMLFSVDTEDATVESELPYAGRVGVTLKRAAPLRLRRPEGVDVERLSLSIDGTPCIPREEGRYLTFDPLPPGSRVEMCFPLEVRTTTETVAGVEYGVSWKGNAVTALSPPGPGYATYKRALYLQERPPLDSRPHRQQGTPVQW